MGLRRSAVRLWRAGGLWACTATLALPPAVRADAPTLEQYMEVLTAQRLAPAAARDLDELQALLERAQRERLEGRRGRAARLLARITDGPRYADFRDFDAYHDAEYTLATVLLELGAAKSAARYLERILARGADSAYYEPAFRRAVDASLALGIPESLLESLATRAEQNPSDDARSEVAYLRGRTAYFAGDAKTAYAELGRVGEHSRFRGSALYLLGALRARGAQYDDAEKKFCAVAALADSNAYGVFADARLNAVRDLSQLGLGRVAHEQARANDAFYYYFQVPEDSRRLDEALFEAAYASYEGGDYDVALDALDQLEAKAPHSPRVAEAALLRGYVLLSRCRFEQAEQHLVAFDRRFGPMRAEVEAILESPARQRSLYRDLALRERDLQRIAEQELSRPPSPNSLLLTLLRVDPEFHETHARLRALREEAARVGALPAELSALETGLREKGRPAPAAQLDPREGLAQRQRRLDELREAIGASSALATRLARAGAKGSERAALREEIRALDAEALAIEQELAQLGREEQADAAAAAGTLASLLRADRAHALQTAHDVRVLERDLEARANALALAALEELHDALSAQLRRARIGRVDAVMGSKRRLELQVESLAAGRFPPELADPMRMQNLLRDDEEYWPFEGEDWPDEFVEAYPEPEGEDE